MHFIVLTTWKCTKEGSTHPFGQFHLYTCVDVVACTMCNLSQLFAKQKYFSFVIFKMSIILCFTLSVADDTSLLIKQKLQFPNIFHVRKYFTFTIIIAKQHNTFQSPQNNQLNYHSNATLTSLARVTNSVDVQADTSGSNQPFFSSQYRVAMPTLPRGHADLAIWPNASVSHQMAYL